MSILSLRQWPPEGSRVHGCLSVSLAGSSHAIKNSGKVIISIISHFSHIKSDAMTWQENKCGLEEMINIDMKSDEVLDILGVRFEHVKSVKSVLSFMR